MDNRSGGIGRGDRDCYVLAARDDVGLGVEPAVGVEPAIGHRSAVGVAIGIIVEHDVGEAGRGADGP
jgi:hypothetical protein